MIIIKVIFEYLWIYYQNKQIKMIFIEIPYKTNSNKVLFTQIISWIDSE